MRGAGARRGACERWCDRRRGTIIKCVGERVELRDDAGSDQEPTFGSLLFSV